MASIYTLTVTCVNDLVLRSECERTIEIEASSSLEELHLAIQQAVRFDNDHLYDFYLANTPRGDRQMLVAQDEFAPEEADYSAVPLESVFPTGRKRLYYLFDYGDHWLFEIRKARGEKEAERRVHYPRVVAKKGPNPEQYPGSDW